MTSPIPQAPPGYAYHGAIGEDIGAKRNYPFWLIIVAANFIALIPLTLGIVGLWIPYQFYKVIGAPYTIYPDLDLPLPILIILWLFILGGSMLLHEWLHGIALTLLGYKPHYAFHKLYLSATIEDGSFLSKRHYLRMSLAPLLIMTVVGGLLLLFLPVAIGQIVLVALLLNSAASLGDMMVAIRVYQQPDEAMFADNQGIQIFLPTNDFQVEKGSG